MNDTDAPARPEPSVTPPPAAGPTPNESAGPSPSGSGASGGTSWLRLATPALALLAAGTILRAHAPGAVADAFLATRLSGSARTTYGQGLDAADTRAIVDRALPY